MTHAELPDAILHEYPDLKLDDLKQNCWGVFYHYTTKKYGIVGGYDFDFFIYSKSERKKVYFDKEQTCDHCSGCDTNIRLDSVGSGRCEYLCRTHNRKVSSTEHCESFNRRHT